MAAVSLFKVVSGAEMQASESEKYKFDEKCYKSLQGVETDINLDGVSKSSNSAFQVNENEFVILDSSEEKQKVGTVGAITAQLTEKIAKAADQKVIQAAKVVEEINVEIQKTGLAVDLSGITEALKLSDMPASQIAVLMQEMTSEFATQTADETDQVGVIPSKANDQQLSESAITFDQIHTPQTLLAQSNTWMPNINTTFNNTINTLNTYSSLPLKDTKTKLPEIVRGEAIIKAGRAKTNFAPSSTATELTVKKLTFDSTHPQNTFNQIRQVQNYTQRFNGALTRYGLDVNDVADAFLGAYALSFEAAYDKALNGEDLINRRKQYQQHFLQNSYFQGDSDINKQVFYELKAVMAMQAMEWREKARQAPTAKEREYAEKKAVYYAQNILKK